MLHIKHTCTSLSLPCLTTMTHCCFLCIMNTLVECKLALSVFKFSEWLDVTAVGKTQLALASWFPSSRDDVWVLSQFSEELLFYCWLCTAVVFTESTWCLCITVLYCIVLQYYLFWVVHHFHTFLPIQQRLIMCIVFAAFCLCKYKRHC